MASLSLHSLVLPFAELGSNDVHFSIDVVSNPLRDTLNLEVEKLDVQVHVQKTEENFLVDLDVKGSVTMSCDRCGEPYSQDINNQLHTLFMPDHYQDKEDDSADSRYFKPSDTGLNIEQDVLDGINLAIPDKKLCKTSCKGLCDHCGVNLNIESCQCQEKQSDPRWDALKNIKFDDS